MDYDADFRQSINLSNFDKVFSNKIKILRVLMQVDKFYIQMSIKKLNMIQNFERLTVDS